MTYTQNFPNKKPTSSQTITCLSPKWRGHPTPGTTATSSAPKLSAVHTATKRVKPGLRMIRIQPDVFFFPSAFWPSRNMIIWFVTGRFDHLSIPWTREHVESDVKKHLTAPVTWSMLRIPNWSPSTGPKISFPHLLQDGSLVSISPGRTEYQELLNTALLKIILSQGMAHSEAFQAQDARIGRPISHQISIHIQTKKCVIKCHIYIDTNTNVALQRLRSQQQQA